MTLVTIVNLLPSEKTSYSMTSSSRGSPNEFVKNFYPEHKFIFLCRQFHCSSLEKANRRHDQPVKYGQNFLAPPKKSYNKNSQYFMFLPF